MTPRPRPAPWIGPRPTGLAGLAAVLALSTGVALAYASFPGYRMTLGYISELAHKANPGRVFFTIGLLVAGPLIAGFGLGLYRLMENRPGRVAARLFTVTGLSMPVVAVFDLDSPIPHFTAATLLFGSAVLGTACAASGFGRMAVAASGPARRRLRVISSLAWAVFGLQVASTLSGFAFTAYLVSRMSVTSAEQLLRELPRHQTLRLGAEGPFLNPVALLEWVFVGTAMVLIVLASVHALGSRPTSCPSSASRGRSA